MDNPSRPRSMVVINPHSGVAIFVKRRAKSMLKWYLMGMLDEGEHDHLLMEINGGIKVTWGTYNTI